MPNRAKKPTQSRRRASSRKPARSKSRASEGSSPAAMPSADRHARLGTKYTCFSCGAKFYDLNKPEPVCPKCGTDQRTRPARSETPPAAAPLPVRPPPPPRPMATLLAEEEEAEPAYEEDLEIGLPGLDDDDIFSGDEIRTSEDETED